MRKIGWSLLIWAISLCWTGLFGSAHGQDNGQAALARALQGVTTTLEAGLGASEAEGKPISAKFELENGKLQLSVYTTKGNEFMEVVVDPKTGAVAKAEKITEGADLKEATAEKTATANATVSLPAAAEAAIRANPGFRAVSVFPQLENGRPVAAVTLLQGAAFKKVRQKLD